MRVFIRNWESVRGEFIERFLELREISAFRLAGNAKRALIRTAELAGEDTCKGGEEA